MNDNTSQKHYLVILLACAILCTSAVAFQIKPLAIEQWGTMSENILGLESRINSLPHQDVAILFLVFWIWAILYTLINVVADNCCNKKQEKEHGVELLKIPTQVNLEEIISKLFANFFAISITLNLLHFQMIAVSYVYNNPLIPTNSDLILIPFVLTVAANIAHFNTLLYREISKYLNDLMPVGVSIIQDIIRLDKIGGTNGKK